MVGLGGPVVVGLGGPAPAAPRDASCTTSRTNSHRAHTPEKSMARPDTHEFVRTPEFEGVSNVIDMFRYVSYFTHFISFISFNKPPCG